MCQRSLPAGVLLGAVVVILSIETGCGSSSPTAPTASSAAVVPTYACAGQSNAVALCGTTLASYATVVGSWANSRPITDWAVDGPLWPGLKAALHQHPSVLIWWQGEAEVLAPIYGTSAVASYGAAFADVVARARIEASNPALPVIIVEFGPGYIHGADESPAWDAYNFRRSDVWRDLRAFAAADGHAVLISTEDLAFNPDGTHAPEATYQAIAQRIVAAFR